MVSSEFFFVIVLIVLFAAFPCGENGKKDPASGGLGGHDYMCHTNDSGHGVTGEVVQQLVWLGGE